MSVKRKRNKTLTVRLTEKEYNLIHSKSKKAKMNITNYIVALSNELPIKVSEDVKPLLIELKRIGNNLNQITMKINSGAFDSYNFSEVVEQQKKIYEQLYEIARKG